MRIARGLTLVSFLICALPGISHAQEADDMMLGFELAALLDVQVVTASAGSDTLLDAPAPMYVLTKQDIRNRGYTSWAEIITDLPGFDVSYVGGNTDIYAYQRGFRSSFFNRTLVLLNGKVFNTLWYQDAQLGPGITVANIETIEILYGPAGAVYGPNAFLGVINIITADGSDLKPNTYELNSTFTAGDWNTRRVDLVGKGKVGDDVSFAISARMNRSDGWDVDGRDNHWMWNEYQSSETIFGDVGDKAQMGYNFNEYSNPEDDRMLMATVNVGDFTLEGHAYHLAGSNGPQYAGDHTQGANFWPARGSTVSIEHNGKIGDDMSIKSTFSFREDQRYGLWVDAFPSWNENQEEYSYITMIDFHVKNSGIFFGQNLVWDVSDDLRISTGYRYERKELSKAYDVGDGYWAAYNSNGPENSDAIYDTYPTTNEDGTEGPGLNYTTGEPTPFDQGVPTGWRMPHDNLVLTSDLGGFVEGSYKMGDLKLNVGIRYDINSNPQATEFEAWDGELHNGYKVFSPRAGLVYKLGKVGPIDAGAVKLLYGTAVQEGAPAQLWGGWSGRSAVPGLRPEEGQNTELVIMAQTGPVLSDVSIYYATYRKVHVSPVANAGRRQIMGIDYKGRYQLDNPLSARKISGYLNYSWAKATSSRTYDFEGGDWVAFGDGWEGDNETGDIAPHKIHFGLNLPILENFNLNLRTRYIAQRMPFIGQPLADSSRDDGGEPDYFHSFLVFDANVSATWDNITLSLVGRNLTDEDYNHTGDGNANAGDSWGEGNTIDLKKRASGYRNSLIPQPLRNIMLTLRVDI